MSTVRLVHFSTLDFRSQHLKDTLVSPFFSLFKGYKLKYRDNTFNQIDYNGDDIKVPQLNTSNERRQEAAKDLVDALTDDDTDIIWIYTGGNPQDITKSEQIITEFIYSIHQQSITLHNRNAFIPKPMVGYCLAVPLLLYLTSRGLIKAIHGALGCDIFHINKDDEYRESLIHSYGNILSQNYDSHIITDLKPENNTAIEMINNGKTIDGIIIGGLLQILHNVIMIGQIVENQVGIKHLLRNQQIILFVELLAMGNEKEFAQKLMQLVMNNGIQIKALALGHVYEADKVEDVRREICNAANAHGIPVVSGLKVGHAGRQHPILMSSATLKFDASKGGLNVKYQKDTISILRNVDPKLLWNKQELKNDEIKVQPNVSDSLCVVL